MSTYKKKRGRQETIERERERSKGKWRFGWKGRNEERNVTKEGPRGRASPLQRRGRHPPATWGSMGTLSKGKEKKEMRNEKWRFQENGHFFFSSHLPFVGEDRWACRERRCSAGSDGCSARGSAGCSDRRLGGWDWWSGRASRARWGCGKMSNGRSTLLEEPFVFFWGMREWKNGENGSNEWIEWMWMNERRREFIKEMRARRKGKTRGLSSTWPLSFLSFSLFWTWYFWRKRIIRKKIFLP